MAGHRKHMTDGPQDGEGNDLWARLSRRKVVQWGLAYAAGAWALLQVIGFAADAFHWPDVTKQLSMLTLAIGLPVAMTLAWYHGDRGEQSVTRACSSAAACSGSSGIAASSRQPASTRFLPRRYKRRRSRLRTHVPPSPCCHS
jgi:hypothetical protein